MPIRAARSTDAPLARREATPRVNRIFFGRFERWVLPRMARRLPPWVTPDMLTALGLLSAAFIGAAYMMTSASLLWLWGASAGFVVHWWADSLDGTLARIRKIERERYGFYVDHQADAVAACLIFGGLGFSPLMPLSLALLALAGYLLLMLHVSLVAIARETFKISFGKVGPTEARVFMITVNTLVVVLGNPVIRVGAIETSVFGVVGLVGGIGLIGIYLVSSVWEGMQLARVDPPREAPRSTTNVGTSSANHEAGVGDR